jgi:hypothetical protein
MLRNAFIGLALSCSLGCHVTVHVHLSEPAPAPAPVPPAVKHTGHFTVSLIEPKYTRADVAAIRHDLAGFDWATLDTSFRGYSDGQEQVTSLGFGTQFTPADLPIVFVQETQPSGAAPIIDRMKPTSAAVVIDRIKALRGRP